MKDDSEIKVGKTRFLIQHHNGKQLFSSFKHPIKYFKIFT